MADPNRPPRPTSSLETPLLGSRTFQSAAASATASKLPQRRPSVSSTDYAAGVTMTTGRLPALSRQGSNGSLNNAPATVSRLPTRRPSISDGPRIPVPATASRIGTLKRTSSAAGLQPDSEISTLKRQISRLTSSLEDATATHSRLLLESQSTSSHLQTENASLIARNERLERHRSTLLADKHAQEARESAFKEELAKLREESNRSVREARGELSGLRERNSELEREARELRHECVSELSRAQRESDRADMGERELERVSEEKERVEKELEEERDKRRKAEEERDNAKLNRGDEEKNELVRDELHRQVTHLRTLESTNSKLTRRLETFEKQHANLEILKESNRALEKKSRGVEELRNKVASLEVEVERARREKEEWEVFLSLPEKAGETGSPSSSSPAISRVKGEDYASPKKVTKSLMALQIENRSLHELLDTRQLEVGSRTRMIGELERRIAGLEEEVRSAKKETEKYLEKELRADGEKNLLRQEVEMLKRHLATYATEESVLHPSGSYDTQKSARIEELETLLVAHQREIAELARQSSHWRGLVERYGGSTTEIVEGEGGKVKVEEVEDETKVVVSKSLEEQLKKNEALEIECAKLRDGHELLMKEIESLEIANDRLTYEHNNGAYDPSTTKVLEFKQNPDLVEHAVRTSTLERLKEENRALLDSLKELESRKGGLGGDGESMVPRQSWVNAQKELEDALAVVKQKEILGDRTKKAFAEKADEFRKVVFSLLGYQLTFLSDGRVRLSSAFAHSKDHSLLFRSNAGDTGTMELIGAGSDKVALSEEVRSQMQFWVQQRQCIPGFLAALTLTMFEATTRGGKAGFVLGD